MTHVLHLFDGDADWEQRVAVAQLLGSIPRDRCRQTLASVDARVPAADWFSNGEVVRFPVRFGAGFLGAASVRRLVQRHRIDVIHAWGTLAASAAAGAARQTGCALLVGRFDPGVTDRQAKLLSTLSQGPAFAISCASGTVRRRLIEKGVSPDACVIVRPGVDFAVINTAKGNTSIRADLGLSPDDRVIVAGHPVVRGGGHERIVWSAQLRHYFDTSYRTIIYGNSPECVRLRRLSRGLSFAHSVIWPGSRYRYEELIAVADVHVITPTRDVSTTSVAWAMAASVPVIGTAVHSIAELITHHRNGLLIKPQPGPGMAVSIAAGLLELHTLTKETEAARGQAYQVFGVRRFADQHVQLYDHLVAGQPPGKGIKDSAID